jgi:hypothetical protein
MFFRSIAGAVGVAAGLTLVAVTSTPTLAANSAPTESRTRQVQPVANRTSVIDQFSASCGNQIVPGARTRTQMNLIRLRAAKCAILYAQDAGRRSVSQAHDATRIERIAWTFTAGWDGFSPQSPLIEDDNGALFGENVGCNVDACYNGIIYKLTPPHPGQTRWTETTIFAFPGTNTFPGALGANPSGGLIMDRYGALYGTATVGGDLACEAPNGCGVVFKLTPPHPGQSAWTENVLHNFSIRDGAHPNGRLVMDERGILYGTTSGGGPIFQNTYFGNGVVFKLAPPAAGQAGWTYGLVYAFTGAFGDGYYPTGALVPDAHGNLYGTTQLGGGPNGGGSPCGWFGGSSGCGTAFKLTKPAGGQGAWIKTVLHSFTGFADGNVPTAALVVTGGALYGTTSAGGTNCLTTPRTGCGVAFQLTPPLAGQTAWNENVLYDFGTSSTDADTPNGLTVADGALIGTSTYGGSTGSGTVFALIPPNNPHASWNERLLYNFSGGADGDEPTDAAFVDRRGRLFGTTKYGGSPAGTAGNGVVFELEKGP